MKRDWSTEQNSTKAMYVVAASIAGLIGGAALAVQFSIGTLLASAIGSIVSASAAMSVAIRRA